MKKVEYIDLNKKNDEILEQIKVICPEYFQEGEFDIESFYQRFKNESENNNERYGLWWKGKIESSKKIINDNSKTLSPIKEKSLNFDNAKNIIIEGNNLDALKILKNSYSNSIDIIYIDPPYNTGNDFVYNDNKRMSLNEYKEIQLGYESKNLETGSRYHTNWLNMIYPRLKIARSFLRNDGFICISIDDNEQARLKIICDEIFGEQNFVSCVVWQKKNDGSGDDSKYLKNLTEYLLIYAKNINDLILNKFIRNVDDGSYKFVDEHFNTRGKYKLKNLDGSSLTWSENLDYEIFYNNKYYYPGGVNKTEWMNRKEFHAEKDWRWRWSKKKFDWGIENGFIVYKNNKFYSKQYQYVDNNNEELKRESPYSNLILSNPDFQNESGSILFVTGNSGTLELKNLFNDLKVFDHPKPIKLLSHIINLHPNKNAIVFDFFAGSGTTGHAVMELNKKDNGNRKYILVQLDEKAENSNYEIISEITRNRIIKSVEKNNYIDGNFKFFKIIDSNFKTFSSSLNETLFNSNVKLGTNNLDLFYEIILNYGLDLNHKFISITLDNIEYYYDEGVTNIFAIFSSDYSKLTNHIFEIKKGMEDTETNLYLREDFFANDNQKINILKLLENKYKNITIRVM